MMAEKHTRKKLLDRIEKAAYDYEADAHGCSRCTFKALQDYLDLGDGTALRASTPLAAGIALRGETCGALLAGLLAVGIAIASEDMADREAHRKCLGAGFRFIGKVEKEFGTTNCTKIQTEKLGRYYSLGDPEQYKGFVEAGGYTECSKVCGKIARMTAEFILDYQDQRGEGG
jgi:C_GCAxxG_C_C family probable redox protein